MVLGMIPFIFGCWALLVALTAAWLWLRATRRPAATASERPASDPYAGIVAQFRRQLHDWDRQGRP